MIRGSFRKLPEDGLKRNCFYCNESAKGTLSLKNDEIRVCYTCAKLYGKIKRFRELIPKRQDNKKSLKISEIHTGKNEQMAIVESLSSSNNLGEEK